MYVGRYRNRSAGTNVDARGGWYRNEAGRFCFCRDVKRTERPFIDCKCMYGLTACGKVRGIG